jgi:uncharacterized protein (DUF1330 family)
MPKGYLIAAIRVHDQEGYERFRAASGPAIAAYGGRVLVRNPNPERREGKLDGITIVVEFDSLDAARRFYESPEYTAARALREKAAETDLLLVEGV